VSYTQFFDVANTSTTINTTYTFSPGGATPDLFWIVFAVASFCLLTICLVLPLRLPDRTVNPARIAISALSVIVSGMTAGLSLVVDINSGVGAAGALNQSVIVNMHTLYQGYAIPVVFVVFGLLAFANLIYCLLQPEMVKPDIGEYGRSDLDAKVRAERGRGKNQTEDQD
jgi:hypothetical protein